MERRSRRNPWRPSCWMIAACLFLACLASAVYATPRDTGRAQNGGKLAPHSTDSGRIARTRQPDKTYDSIPAADVKIVDRIFTKAKGRMVDDASIAYLCVLLGIERYRDAAGTIAYRWDPPLTGDASNAGNMDDNLEIVEHAITRNVNGPMFKWLASMEWDGCASESVCDWAGAFITAHPEVFFSDDVYVGSLEKELSSDAGITFGTDRDEKRHLNSVRAFVKKASGRPRERAEQWYKAMAESIRREHVELGR
jgi:hypothetical protein